MSYLARLTVGILLTLLLPLTACKKREEPSSLKPTVLVSVPCYAYFVKKIAQDTVAIESLLPSGNNPHIYEPTPRAVEQHQNAKLWIYLGEPFDKKVLSFFQQQKHPIQILDITEGIELLSTEEEHLHLDEEKDLHIWLSPSLAKIQAKKIASSLIALLPEQKSHFEENLHLLLEELDRVDKQISILLTPMKGKAILVSHPAFGYFCKEYQLIQLSVEIEGKDPLPQHISHLLDEAKRLCVHSVLLEPQYSNKGAELIAEKLNVPTYMIDPYAENYTENLLSITHKIVEASHE